MTNQTLTQMTNFVTTSSLVGHNDTDNIIDISCKVPNESITVTIPTLKESQKHFKNFEMEKFNETFITAENAREITNYANNELIIHPLSYQELELINNEIIDKSNNGEHSLKVHSLRQDSQEYLVKKGYTVEKITDYALTGTKNMGYKISW